MVDMGESNAMMESVRGEDTKRRDEGRVVGSMVDVGPSLVVWILTASSLPIRHRARGRIQAGKQGRECPKRGYGVGRREKSAVLAHRL